MIMLRLYQATHFDLCLGSMIISVNLALIKTINPGARLASIDLCFYLEE